MKQYFVNYYWDFANTYNLLHIDSENPAHIAALSERYPRAERITRREAERLCVKERAARRRNGGMFAFRADAHIFPVDYNVYREDYMDDYKFRVNGYIIERV